jgi:hypothetical protein
VNSTTKTTYTVCRYLVLRTSLAFHTRQCLSVLVLLQVLVQQELQTGTRSSVLAARVDGGCMGVE